MTNFDILFKGSEKIDENTYRCSSTKRATLIIPIGKKVFDEGTNTWYYGDGSTVGGIEFSDAAGFSVAGDLTSTSTAVDWDLLDNSTSALSFDAAGKAGILNIVTTNSGEGVTMAGTLGVTGAQTLTGATYANGGVDRSAAAALAIGATNANAVDISKTGVTTTIKGAFNVDQAASFDSTVTNTGITYANGGIDRTTSGTLNIATGNPSGVSISKAGVTTTINGGFSVTGSTTLSSGVVMGNIAVPFTVNTSVSGVSFVSISGASGLYSGVSGTYSSADGYLKVSLNGSIVRIPYFVDVD
jgi:fibronectin-binding autotransporter adhesin